VTSRTSSFFRFLKWLPLLALAGCSPATFVNTLTFGGDYELQSDIAYGTSPRQKLDIYRPEKAKNAPIVVFFYGGNWQDGSKDLYLFLGKALADRGFLTVILDYRVYPDVRYPTFLEDGAQALRWVQDHGAEEGGDTRRIFLLGHSAGAYNAAMLTLDKRWLTEAGFDMSRLKGLVGLAGPYDFLPLTDPTLKIIFGPPEHWPETQPIRYARADAPPMLLVTGTDDDTVKPGNTTRLAQRQRELGASAEEKYYPGVGHIELIGSFSWLLRFRAPALADTVDFMRAH